MTAKRHGNAGGSQRRAFVAVAVVLGLACSAPGKDGPAQKVTPQLLDALAQQYRDAGLPLPPPDAFPVMLQVGAVGGGVAWAIGFRVGPGPNGEATGLFLVGTETGEPFVTDGKQHAIRPLDASKGLPPTNVPLHGGWTYRPEAFPVNHWLALAVQCHLRGDDRLAEQIFERGLTRDATAARRLTPLGDGGPRDSLAATAWNHWMNALLAGGDRKEILARLEKLSAAFPAFLDGPFQRDYLASLRLAVAPSKAEPDSAEALVDGLLEHNVADNTTGPRLMALGFGAVPALIAHLDDRRLTRGATWRQDGTNDPERVSELASGLVQAIAGNVAEFAAGVPDRAGVERWWARAGATGEETYMAREVFPPTEVSLEIVADRYPRRLEEIYARLLREQPDTSVESVVQAIGACALLKPEERVRLLRAGMASPTLNSWYEALGVLLTLDQEAGEAAWIERLDRWPVEAQGSYALQSPEAGVSDLMLNTDSAEVWRAYERALFRARPALRMEMLARLAGVHAEPPQDVRQMALLDLFLDDPEVRVIRKEDEAAGGKFEGYPVTPENRRMSVGEFVTELLGKALRVKPPPGPARTERWWAKYREAVRAAVDKHERAALLTPFEES